MTVTCYKVSDDRKVVNKTLNLSQAIVLTVDNKSTVDLLKPRLIVGYPSVTFAYNYLYCSATGYYYFIDSFTALTGGRIALNCSIDVRMSLSYFITNDMSCTVLRTGKGITTIHDSKLPIEPDKCKKQWATLDSPFTQTQDSYRIVCGIFNSRS